MSDTGVTLTIVVTAVLTLFVSILIFGSADLYSDNKIKAACYELQMGGCDQLVEKLSEDK